MLVATRPTARNVQKRHVAWPDPEVQAAVEGSGVFALPPQARTVLLEILQHYSADLLRCVRNPGSFFLLHRTNPLSYCSDGVLLDPAYRVPLTKLRDILHAALSGGAEFMDELSRYLRAELSKEKV